MIPSALVPVATHLWQSTLFAIFAALLILLSRNNQARIRYWIWLAASYKFLLPFSLLVSAGQLIHWRSAPPIEMSPMVSVVTDTVTMPVFFAPAVPITPHPNHLAVLLIAICAVWAAGAVVVLGFWMREWLRIRQIANSASPLQLDLPIDVRTTSAQIEPGIFGIFRSTLLLPDGIANRLTPAQLKGVLAHEMAHVRRKDNLTAMIHMLVEAVFWFHPLVWWIGARMVDERERACDEQVLLEGEEAQAYAESIVKICEYYLESPLRCMSGITGSDLKKRVQRIMEKNFGASIGGGKKLVLAGATILALAAPIVAGLLTAAPRQGAQGPAQQQSSPALPATTERLQFQTVSITKSPSGVPSLDFAEPSGIDLTAMQLRALIGLAYGIRSYTLIAGPEWQNLLSEQFDIKATSAGNPTVSEKRVMAQSLLEDRFKLAMHRETRRVSAYALVAVQPGKNGPKLTPHVDDSKCYDRSIGPPADAKDFVIACGGINIVPVLTGQKITMEQLAEAMANYVGSAVVDQTGLSGTFDFTFDFTPVRLNRGVAPGPSDAPSVSAALQEQLGLRLEPNRLK